MQKIIKNSKNYEIHKIRKFHILEISHNTVYVDLLTYISPRNILTAFWATVCLQPATLKPISSRCAIVFDFALATFQRVEPHMLSLF